MASIVAICSPVTGSNTLALVLPSTCCMAPTTAICLETGMSFIFVSSETPEIAETVAAYLAVLFSKDGAYFAIASRSVRLR